MKKFFFKTLIFILSILVISISILSTTGITTDKFNKIILNKIDKDYKNTSLELEKVKFKFDIKKLSLFIETKNPKIHKNVPRWV